LKTILGEGGAMTEREEELLNSRQVAVILDLSPDTVNEFARKNILPAFKKGKQWRFRRRDISIFYKKQSRDIRDA
jgi:excisionase family DNA binding protein